MIRESEAETYLKCVREIAQSHDIVDAHVHPFEVMFGATEYTPDPEQPGVYSSGGATYRSPARGGWESAPERKNSPDEGRELRPGIASLFLKSTYVHTGPKCLADQLEMAGIRKAILLPVFQPCEESESQMSTLRKMFGGDRRFAIGYNVPNRVQTEQIPAATKEALTAYGIRILKIHPNISRIDPGSEEGKRRMESILAASRECRLKVVIHGGASPVLSPPERNFATLQKLKDTAFDITDQAVILAHACTYGCGTEEVLELLPLLNRLLARHENLMVDISATGLEVLCLLLKHIDHERIVFGSDALYELPWKTAVKLLHGLKLTHSAYQDEFIKISSTNALRLFRKEFDHDPADQNEILPIPRAMEERWPAASPQVQHL